MKLNQALLSFRGNAESALLTTAMHYAVTGTIDLKQMDVDALAMGVFALVSQLEAERPGISSQHGYAKITDLQAFGLALENAAQATKPSGLIG
jgi:hypothetical protein